MYVKRQSKNKSILNIHSMNLYELRNTEIFVVRTYKTGRLLCFNIFKIKCQLNYPHIKFKYQKMYRFIIEDKAT